MGRRLKSGAGAGTTDVPESPTWQIIKSLVAAEADASRLLEMYYWTREPGIVEMIRAYLALPEQAQRHINGFLVSNRPQAIATAIDQQGRLVLSAGDVQNPPKGQRTS